MNRKMVKSDLISGLISGGHIRPGPDMAGYENLAGFRPGPDIISGATLLFMHCYGFLSQGFTDRCEILHGGSATSRKGLLPILGDSPSDSRVLSVDRGHVVGYASC